MSVTKIFTILLLLGLLKKLQNVFTERSTSRNATGKADGTGGGGGEESDSVYD